MNKKILGAILVAIAIVAVAGYLFYGPSNLSITVRDPPPQPYDRNISKILVSFDKIELHAANAGNESGWHTITTNATIDLMQTLNVSKLLGKAQIPPGTYTELRFFTSQANITISGAVVTYTIPSGAQSGIKVLIQGGFTVVGGQSRTVQLDFAFKNSEIMSNPTHMLNPVVSATVA